MADMGVEDLGVARNQLHAFGTSRVWLRPWNARLPVARMVGMSDLVSVLFSPGLPQSLLGATGRLVSFQSFCLFVALGVAVFDQAMECATWSTRGFCSLDSLSRPHGWKMELPCVSGGDWNWQQYRKSPVTGETSTSWPHTQRGGT